MSDATTTSQISCPEGHENPEGFDYCGTCGRCLDPDVAAEVTYEDLTDVIQIEVTALELLTPDPAAGETRPRVGSRLAVHNHCDHDVRAVTGTIVFSDVFDRPRAAYAITIDTIELPARSTVVDGSFGVYLDPQENPQDDWLAEHVDGPWTQMWIPEAVLFTDGTLLGQIHEED